MTGTKSWLPLYESPSSHWAKDECNWRKGLQHLRHVCTAKPDCDVCSWRAQTSKKHCIEYLHSPPGSTLQSPEAAHLAVLTLPKQLHHQWQHSSVSSSRLFFQWRWSHGSSGWSWWSSTNHHQVGQHCGATTEACRTAGSPSPWWCYCQHCSPSYYNNTSQKCSSTGCLRLHSHQAKPICVAGGRHTDWKVCKTALPALLAGCAVFAQKLVHQGSYTSGYRQHSNHFLVADTNQQVTLKQMEQMMDALTSSPCMSDNVSKHKGLMLLLIACLQWGQVCSSYQPDLRTKLHTKPGYPGCTNCDVLDCSVPPSVVAQ